MTAAQVLSSDRQNRIEELKNKRLGHLANKEKVYSFGISTPLPVVQNVVSQGLQAYTQAASASKPTSMQQLMGTQRSQSLHTKSKTYTVAPSSQAPLSVSQQLISSRSSKGTVQKQPQANNDSLKLGNLTTQLRSFKDRLTAEEKASVQQQLLNPTDELSKEAAKISDLNTELAVRKLKSDLKKDHLKDIDEVVSRFDNVLKRLIKLNEDRANDIYRQLDDRTKKIESITAFQQKLNIALSQKDANGAIDWSNNDEMKKMVDQMRLLGIELPEGYTYDAQQVSLIKSNADMVKSSLQNLSKMLQTDMSEVSQRLNNLYMILSSLWKAMFDILMRIAQRIGE